MGLAVHYDRDVLPRYCRHIAVASYDDDLLRRSIVTVMFRESIANNHSDCSVSTCLPTPPPPPDFLITAEPTRRTEILGVFIWLVVPRERKEILSGVPSTMPRMYWQDWIWTR